MQLELSFEEFSTLCKKFGIKINRIDNNTNARVYLSSPFPKELVNPPNKKEELIEKFPTLKDLLSNETQNEAIKELKKITGYSTIYCKNIVEEALKEQ